MSYFRSVWAYLLALAALIILGTASAAQYALAMIASLRVEIPVGVWIETTLHDVVGMAPLYGVIFGLGLLLGMMGGALASRFLPFSRVVIFGVAGFAAILATYLAMESFFAMSGADITPIGATRFWHGLLVQCLMGGIAGMIYARASRQKN